MFASWKLLSTFLGIPNLEDVLVKEMMILVALWADGGSWCRWWTFNALLEEERECQSCCACEERGSGASGDVEGAEGGGEGGWDLLAGNSRDERLNSR